MDEPQRHDDAFTAIIIEIFRLNNLILEDGDRIAQPVGLSSARWQVLGIVEHGAVPVAHVARNLGLSRQTVQQTADGLARDGFITYRENPHHRRAKLVQITAQGTQALEYVQAQQQAWAEQISGGQALGELQQALGVLRAIRERLECNPSRPVNKRRMTDETEPLEPDGH